MKKTKTSLARKIFIVFDYLVLIFLAVVCLLPILHVAFASVSDPNWVMNQSGLILKPHGFTLEGYKLVFQTRQLMGSYGNTLFYVFASTALGMLITVLGAYPLSKSDLLWSNALMLIISFTMMFSGGIITFYMVVRSLGMYNTRLAVILPTCVSAFNLILVRTAMATLPKELEESARLDGAGPIAVLFKIVLPLIKATLATVTLYYVVANWNSWFNAMIYLRDADKMPIQIFLRDILTRSQLGVMTGQTDIEDNGWIY